MLSALTAGTGQLAEAGGVHPDLGWYGLPLIVVVRVAVSRAPALVRCRRPAWAG